MGKVINLPLPEITEERCIEILSNVACMTEPLAVSKVMALEFLNYKFNRNNGMSAKGLQKLGFPIEFEIKYLEERLEAAEGGKDGD